MIDCSCLQGRLMMECRNGVETRDTETNTELGTRGPCKKRCQSLHRWREGTTAAAVATAGWRLLGITLLVTKTQEE